MRERMKDFLKKFQADQRGITGLETAIILIAFVIVASVFSFVVLSTGLFSAERGKETIYAGLKKAQGNLELHGGVVVAATVADPVVAGDIYFTLALAAGGSPISLDTTAGVINRVIMNYVDAGSRLGNLTYVATEILGDGDTMLETGELFEIDIDIGTNTISLASNEAYTLEVVVPQGSTMLVARTMPPAIDAVMDLH